MERRDWSDSFVYVTIIIENFKSGKPRVLYSTKPQNIEFFTYIKLSRPYIPQ